MSVSGIFGQIKHDIVVQKDYISSYLVVLLIFAVAIFIDRNHNNHIHDGKYIIRPLEDFLGLSFKGTDLTLIIFTLAGILAFFVFIISVMVKRTRLEKLQLVNQLKVQAARDDLLALASHQLRTPATGVKQYLGIIRDDLAGEISPKQKKLIDKAYFHNERQLRIINDFLYMAKLDAERIIIHPRDFDLIELVDETLKNYDYKIKAKNLTIDRNMPASLSVNSDKQCIRMALENLISNACKYTRIGGKVKIQVAFDDVTANVIIEDNGVGVRKSETKNLFKKFSRIDNPLSGQEGGSGIGLYIAKKLIELNHGEICYKAQPRGSKFVMELPLK